MAVCGNVQKVDSKFQGIYGSKRHHTSSQVGRQISSNMRLSENFYICIFYAVIQVFWCRNCATVSIPTLLKTPKLEGPDKRQKPVREFDIECSFALAMFSMIINPAALELKRISLHVTNSWVENVFHSVSPSDK